MSLMFIIIFLLAIFAFSYMVMFQEVKTGVTNAPEYWKSFRAMWDELIPQFDYEISEFYTGDPGIYVNPLNLF